MGSFSIAFAKIFNSNPYQYQTDSLFTSQRSTYFGVPTSTRAAVIITYIDENGFTWTSQSSGNDQIGSFVNIFYSFPDGGDGYRYTVKGNFNCILYNTSSPGQYKNITNGSFTAKFGNGN